MIQDDESDNATNFVKRNMSKFKRRNDKSGRNTTNQSPSKNTGFKSTMKLQSSSNKQKSPESPSFIQISIEMNNVKVDPTV